MNQIMELDILHLFANVEKHLAERFRLNESLYPYNLTLVWNKFNNKLVKH